MLGEDDDKPSVDDPAAGVLPSAPDSDFVLDAAGFLDGAPGRPEDEDEGESAVFLAGAAAGPLEAAAPSLDEELSGVSFLGTLLRRVL